MQLSFSHCIEGRSSYRGCSSLIPRLQHPHFAARSCDGTRRSTRVRRLQSTTSDDDNTDNPTNEDISTIESSKRTKMKALLRQTFSSATTQVQNLVPNKSLLSRGGSPIAGVLTDAALNAANIAKEEVRIRSIGVIQNRMLSRGGAGSSNAMELETQARIEADAQVAMDAISLSKTSVADAFEQAESSIALAQRELERAKSELAEAKKDATLGLAVAEKAVAEAVVKARWGTESVMEVAFRDSGGVEEEKEVGKLESVVMENKVVAAEFSNESTEVLASEVVPEDAATQSDEVETQLSTDSWEADLSSLKYEDVDYTLTDMAPPFINEDECLVPGEPVVRVEKAPQNSRRIFAGIDIPVSVEDVWNLLTDYANLQKVIPNLVVNEILELYPGSGDGSIELVSNAALSDADQCQEIAQHMKGAVLKQVGGAKVVGINFSARTTLEVREWPQG